MCKLRWPLLARHIIIYHRLWAAGNHRIALGRGAPDDVHLHLLFIPVSGRQEEEEGRLGVGDEG